MIATICFLVAVILFALAVFSVAVVFTLQTLPLGFLFLALGLLAQVWPTRARAE